MTGVSSRVGDWYRADPAQSCHCRWSKEATVQGFFETATTLSEEMPPDRHEPGSTDCPIWEHHRTVPRC